MADTTRIPPRPLRNALTCLRTVWALVAAIFVAMALLDPANLLANAEFALRALIGTAPYILTAVLLLAYLKASGAEVIVARAFQGREVRMIFLAAAIGGLAPFCSCQVIPFIAGLLALGAPLSAVMAFWLSSPLIDPPTLLITAAALGWPFAIAKAVAAVSLGLFGGFVVRAMMRRGAFAAPLRLYKSSGCCNAGVRMDGKPVWRFWQAAARRAVFRAEFASNGIFLLKWMSLAYTFEALLVRYVPAELIAGFVGGDGIVPIATAAIVGMPAYLNSYVAPPLLAGLMEQGMSAGAAMAFIIAGAVSSIPAMAAVWSLVKPQVFAMYLGLGISGAILAGLLFQML
jgi:uncharacterized protein